MDIGVPPGEESRFLSTSLFDIAIIVSLFIILPILYVYY